MAPTLSTASSRALSVSRGKRTSERPDSSILHSKSRSHLIARARDRSRHGRVSASSGYGSKDIIDLTHDDSDTDDSSPRSAPPTSSSSSRSMTYAELLVVPDTEVVTAKSRETSTPPVAGPTGVKPSRSLTPEHGDFDVLADVLKELDAAKKRVEKFDSANYCKSCKAIMWQPCM